MKDDPLDEKFANATSHSALQFLIAQDPSTAGSPHVVEAGPERPTASIEASQAGPAISPTSKIHNSIIHLQIGTSAAARRIRIHNHGQKKAELEYLRRHVKMLEVRLELLKKASEPTVSNENDNSTRSLGLNSQTGALVAMWKMVAVRQYQRRKQYEITNRDLKRDGLLLAEPNEVTDYGSFRGRKQRCPSLAQRLFQYLALCGQAAHGWQMIAAFPPSPHAATFALARSRQRAMEFDHLLDEASLQDALAFLDHYDHFAPPPAFVTVPVAMPELPASTLTKTQRGIVKSQTGGDSAARSSRRNRGKKKAELERLRHDSKVLEARLARLKKTGGSLSKIGSSSGYSEDESVDEHLTHMSGLAATWKVVAVRQYQRRKQSEIMNRDLKRALVNQQKIAKTMESLFTRRTPQHDMELVYDARATVTHYSKTPESSQNDPIAALLLSRVQHLRLEAEMHLVDAGLAGPDPRSLRTLSVSNHGLGTILETSSCAPIPLNLETADRVLLDGMEALYQDMANVPLKSITFVEGGVDKSYVAAVKSAQCSYNLQVRAVTRNFVSQDRVVFAWTSMGVVANKDLRFQGEGMMVLERSPMAPTHSALLKTWHRMHAEQVESRFGLSSEIEMLKVVGMKALSQNVASYFAALENFLLRAAVDKSEHVFVPSCISW